MKRPTMFDDAYLDQLFRDHVNATCSIPGWHTRLMRCLRDQMQAVEAAGGWLLAAGLPDWSQAPEWAQWWSVDANLWAWWHEEEPKLMGLYWLRGERNDSKYTSDRVIHLPIGIDWRQTLQRRPQASSQQPTASSPKDDDDSDDGLDYAYGPDATAE